MPAPPFTHSASRDACSTVYSVPLLTTPRGCAALRNCATLGPGADPDLHRRCGRSRGVLDEVFIDSRRTALLSRPLSSHLLSPAVTACPPPATPSHHLLASLLHRPLSTPTIYRPSIPPPQPALSPLSPPSAALFIWSFAPGDLSDRRPDASRCTGLPLHRPYTSLPLSHLNPLLFCGTPLCGSFAVDLPNLPAGSTGLRRFSSDLDETSLLHSSLSLPEHSTTAPSSC